MSSRLSERNTPAIPSRPGRYRAAQAGLDSTRHHLAQGRVASHRVGQPARVFRIGTAALDRGRRAAALIDAEVAGQCGRRIEGQAQRGIEAREVMIAIERAGPAAIWIQIAQLCGPAKTDPALIVGGAQNKSIGSAGQASGPVPLPGQRRPFDCTGLIQRLVQRTPVDVTIERAAADRAVVGVAGGRRCR